MRHKYKPLLLAVALTAGGIFTACEKQDIEQPIKQELPAQKSELSVQQKFKVSNYQRAAKILASLQREDKLFAKKVKEGMKLSRPGQENVSFKELLDEASKVKEIATGAAGFKKKFKDLEKMQRADDKQSDFGGIATADDLLAALIADGTQVYFPYSEVFAESLEELTISFDPIDNADVSIGYYYDSAKGKLQEVIVDDDYAYTHPTLIVMEDDDTSGNSLSVSATTLKGQNNARVQGALSGPTTRPYKQNGTQAIGDTINEVYIGYVKVKEHLDGIFDGDNEIRFIRAAGNISMDDNGNIATVSSGFQQTNTDITRYQARNQKDVWFGLLLDTDWDRTEKTQYFAAFEHDPTKEYELKATTAFEINGTIVPGVTAKGTQSQEHITKYKTDHELFTILDYNRKGFFSQNVLPTLGGYTKDGFRVYGTTHKYLEFTMPRVEYIN